MYNSCVLLGMTYVAETWTLTKQERGKPAAAHTTIERSMLNITHKDRNTNICVRERTIVIGIISTVRNMKLSWAGHINRLKDDRGTTRVTTWRPCDFFFFRISSSHIVNSVCWSHALVNGPTSKRPASDGGLCSWQLLMMWSAVCSGSPHSHAALSASPPDKKIRQARPTKRRRDDLGYWSDTTCQRTVQHRLTWRRHAQASIQPRDTTAAYNDDDEMMPGEVKYHTQMVNV